MGHGSKSEPSIRFPALLAALPLLACGCSLEPIEPLVCGNGVVEPERGEDCDRASPSCGSRDSPAPCRYLCGPELECLPGYQCGLDGVCRRPKSAFKESDPVASPNTIGLTVGDLDLDGCDELVSSTVSFEMISGFESRVPGRCKAFQRVFRVSLAPSEQPFAAPVFGVSGGGSELLVADRGQLGESLFTLEIVDEELVPRAHLGTPLRVGQSPLGQALASRVALGDGSDGWLSLTSPSPSQPSMPPPDMPPPDMPPPDMDGQNALFGVSYPSAGAALIDPMFPSGPGGTVALASGDVQAGGCAELVYAPASEPRLGVLSVCPTSPGGAAWSLAVLPDIQLAGGAHLQKVGRPPRDPNSKSLPTSTSLVLVDADGDGQLDVLVNDDSGHIHVAYGIGDGRFHSSSPPLSGAPDQTTSVLASSGDWGITGDFVFAAWPGESPDSPAPHAIIVPLACPTRSSFGSPSCSRGFFNSCAARVGDVDGNGLLDLVFTEPELPGFLVYRGMQAGGFALSSHATSCPPRHVSVADLDGDGLDDVAFHDARAGQSTSTGRIVHSVVKVAFGSPVSVPSSPRLAAVFDASLGRPSVSSTGADQALVSGQFLKKAANQLAAVMSLPDPSGVSPNDTALAAATLEPAANRLMVAPFYFPDPAAGGAPDGAVHVLQMARGRFAMGAGVAVVTTHAPGAAQAPASLWLLNTSAAGASMPLAPVPIACEGCVLATIDIEGDGIDELVSLGNGLITVYRAGAGGSFDASVELTTELDFRGNQGGQLGRMPLPVVADFDGDGRLDIFAMTSAGALVAAWGSGRDDFQLAKLLDPPPCADGKRPPCATRPGFAALELDGSALPEVVVIAPQVLQFHAVSADRTLRRIDVDRGDAGGLPPSFSDYTAAVSGDFDGDGVDDLALVQTSSVVTLLRGLPEIE